MPAPQSGVCRGASVSLSEKCCKRLVSQERALKASCLRLERESPISPRRWLAERLVWQTILNLYKQAFGSIPRLIAASRDLTPQALPPPSTSGIKRTNRRKVPKLRKALCA